MKCFQTLLLVILAISMTQAQITLSNPSFEGIPKDAATPVGWDPCGMSTTPDILPGHWGVERAPVDGKTFIGLITREDNTWEYIGQNLSEPMLANECYTFSAQIARSPTYAGYNQPVKLKIWGGNSRCEKEQLLAFTEPVTHFEWKLYDFLFFPKKSYRYLIIEAHFVDGTVIPYRGNLIIDNCSGIEICERAFVSPPVEDDCDPGC